MTERFPDLEIYLLKPERSAVHHWLTNTIGALTSVKESDAAVHWQHDGLDIIFTENAEKNFSSLWFKQNPTDWPDDLALGRAAYEALGVEVRCSDSGWEEAEGESSEGGWIKINARGERPFSW